MRVIFTCGGTAGHVNPALALAGLIRARKPDSEILFVGARRGIEWQLIEEAGWPFRAVEISSFHRSLKPREIRHNLISLKNLALSPAQARAILKDFPADLVVGTGGYASYPVVRAAAKQGIPTAIHESNAIPGLTTRLLEDHADLIMVGFEECQKNYKHPEKVLVTGTPVRGDFFACTRGEAKAKLGLDDGRPVIVSFWGSLGAAVMNRQMAEFLALEAGDGVPFHHIHGAGTVGCRQMGTYLAQAGADLEKAPGLEVREYIHDMGTLMRAADLVICRAGGAGHHRALPQRGGRPPDLQRPGPGRRRGSGDDPGEQLLRAAPLRHGPGHPDGRQPPPGHGPGHGVPRHGGRRGEDLRRCHGPAPPVAGRIPPHMMD